MSDTTGTEQVAMTARTVFLFILHCTHSTSLIQLGKAVQAVKFESSSNTTRGVQATESLCFNLPQQQGRTWCDYNVAGSIGRDTCGQVISTLRCVTPIPARSSSSGMCKKFTADKIRLYATFWVSRHQAHGRWANVFLHSCT